MAKKSNKRGPVDIFKSRSEVVLDKKRVMRCGMKAHWFLKTKYQLSFSDMGDSLKDEGSGSFVDLAYFVHALLITDDPSLELDDVFDLIDNYGIEKIAEGIQGLFDE